MRKIISFLIVPFLLLVGCMPKENSHTPIPPSEETSTYPATVKKVIDGDTIHLTEPVLGTTKVRLLSIDAPETNYQGKKQSPWGEEATQYLKALLPPGSKITIETDEEEKDGYHRLLAYVHKGEVNINQQMIKKGHAVTYFLYPNQKYFEEYQASYLEAKQAQIGMWDKQNPIDELPSEFRNRVSQQSPTKYVGDYHAKQYVSPAHYKQIPIEKRLYFFSESDAKDAGYQKK